MKALSIRQPWAFAITRGAKLIENRDWQPRNPGLRFRGKFLIHASLKVETKVVDDVIWDVAAHFEEMENVIRTEYVGTRIGAIVGAATVIDVVYESKSMWFHGPVGLVLANPVACKRPVDCKGMLGFFNVPPDVLARLDIPGYVENGKIVE